MTQWISPFLYRAALTGLEIITNGSNNRNPTLKHTKLEKRQSRGTKERIRGNRYDHNTSYTHLTFSKNILLK